MSSESPAAIPAPPPERDDDSVTVASLPLTGSKEKELEDGAVKEGAGEEEVTFPEGGFQAWTQVFGSFLVLFTTFVRVPFLFFSVLALTLLRQGYANA